jgi:hypothetical protein
MKNIFKKQALKVFSSQEIAVVFSEFSQSDLFLNESYSTDWVWHQFNLIQYFLLKSESLTLCEIENILNLNFAKEDFPTQVEESYQWLKQETFSSPVVVSFIPVLLTLFSEESKVKNYKLEFTDYFKSFANVAVVGVVAGLAFYFSFYNSFVLTLVLFLIAYYVSKKFINKMKVKKVEVSIQEKIKSIDKVAATDKYRQLLSIMSGLDLHGLNDTLKAKIDALKKQSLRIAKFIDTKNSAEFIPMWIDVEKMWSQHIPLIVEKYDSQNTELILKTLNAMDFVLEKHMEDVFWDNNIQISSKEKYWLSKVNRELEV